jgi:hypothetical protein
MDSLDLWKSIKVRGPKISIQILTDDTGSMITEVNSIRINHGNDKEIIVLDVLFGIYDLHDKTL